MLSALRSNIAKLSKCSSSEQTHESMGLKWSWGSFDSFFNAQFLFGSLIFVNVAGNVMITNAPLIQGVILEALVFFFVYVFLFFLEQ